MNANNVNSERVQIECAKIANKGIQLLIFAHSYQPDIKNAHQSKDSSNLLTVLSNTDKLFFELSYVLSSIKHAGYDKVMRYDRVQFILKYGWIKSWEIKGELGDSSIWEYVEDSCRLFEDSFERAVMDLSDVIVESLNDIEP